MTLTSTFKPTEWTWGGKKGKKIYCLWFKWNACGLGVSSQHLPTTAELFSHNLRPHPLCTPSDQSDAHTHTLEPCIPLSLSPCLPLLFIPPPPKSSSLPFPFHSPSCLSPLARHWRKGQEVWGRKRRSDRSCFAVFKLLELDGSQEGGRLGRGG